MGERESMRKRFGSSFYMFFFPSPGPALCKLGLARSAVCFAWSLHSGPRTFLWPSLSFSHCHFGLLFPILTDLTDIYRTFHPTASEYTFFSTELVTHCKMDCMLGHKINFSEFKDWNYTKCLFQLQWYCTKNQ